MRLLYLYSEYSKTKKIITAIENFNLLFIEYVAG